jgi:hypothetical protein
MADALRCSRDGRTLVLHSSDRRAARVCDRFVLLSNGAIRGEAPSRIDGAGIRTAGAVDGLEEAFLALT